MAFVDEKAESILAKGAAFNLNSGVKQTFYTVPAGKKAVVTGFILRDASATAATGVITLGGDATPADFIAVVNLTNLNGVAPKKLEVRRIPNATPVAAVDYPAGTVIGGKPTTLVAATCLVDVLGYLI